ncbi:MAG: NTP transferase domain-containing protein [Spirochaetales bacterium]
MTNLDCVVLAAGASSRMGVWKLLLPWQGLTLLESVVAKVTSEGCRALVVVGSREAEVRRRLTGPGVVIVANPAWQTGLFSSVRRGAAQVTTDGFFVTLADLPPGRLPLFDGLLNVRKATPQNPRPRAFRSGSRAQPGHPVLFDAEVAAVLQGFDDNHTMRDVWAHLPPALWYEGPSLSQDFDVPADYPGGGRPLAVLVTGSPGSGKTEALGVLAQSLAARGVKFVGVRQPAVDRSAGGPAPGYDLEICGLAQAGRWPLARRHAFPEPTLTLGPYSFDPSLFARAAQAVREGLESGAEVFVLDEVGRLELDREQGLADALNQGLAATRVVPVVSVRADRREVLGARLESQGFGVVWLDLDRLAGGWQASVESLEAAVQVGLAARA